MAKKNDSLGDRMKGYEGVSRNFLTRRVPAIIRLDGKAFHTFTKGMKKPFDSVLTQTMQETMKYLCENIQGCVLGYTQSDEITLVLTDYATIQTDAWFGYNIQKMCSISASMATSVFNKVFYRSIDNYFNQEDILSTMFGENSESKDRLRQYADTLKNALAKGALFDSRAFSIPKEEVCNCLIWRQQDATRNSIEAVGQANFSHHELHKKTCNMIQEMLWSQRGINWNDFPTELKRGSCCVKQQFEETIDDPRNPGQKITVCRNRWIIDHEIPIFTQDREYIERLI
jgi:tRNA(His) 5'-end guanylyltransferase